VQPAPASPEPIGSRQQQQIPSTGGLPQPAPSREHQRATTGDVQLMQRVQVGE